MNVYGFRFCFVFTPGFLWGSCYQIFSFICMFCCFVDRSLSFCTFFLLAIVLSALLRYTDSDCPFGIFKLFFMPLQYISYIVEKPEAPGQNHWPVESNRHTLSHNIVHRALSATSVVIGTDMHRLLQIQPPYDHDSPHEKIIDTMDSYFFTFFVYFINQMVLDSLQNIT